ncbi:MAG: hypothetical protein JOZ16_02735 [Methylobacteriaceae bacterium]|nr:hypothetical protein [Methylobacteriaceae bacterium]
MMLRRLASSAILALVSGTCLAAEPMENWLKVFPRSAVAEQSVYFHARYLDARGIEHRQEVWRDGSRRVRRVTDDRLDLIVARDADGEYEYKLADRDRHILVIADRTSLYRAGIFSDWDAVAYAFSEPRAEHEIIASGGSEQTASGPCSWTTLIVKAPAASTNRVCWSAEWGLPLSIQDRRNNEWQTQFEIIELRTFQSSDAVFETAPAGYVEMDMRAGEDLSD